MSISSLSCESSNYAVTLTNGRTLFKFLGTDTGRIGGSSMATSYNAVTGEITARRYGIGIFSDSSSRYLAFGYQQSSDKGTAELVYTKNAFTVINTDTGDTVAYSAGWNFTADIYMHYHNIYDAHLSRVKNDTAAWTNGGTTYYYNVKDRYKVSLKLSSGTVELYFVQGLLVDGNW